jgi:hypothetical protein
METTYVFRVAACNRFGVGEFSDTVEVSTGIPYVAPAMTAAPSVSQVSDKVTSFKNGFKDCLFNRYPNKTKH